ncbi:protein borderless [Phlebotomus papatasi]|uniref:protein borderless n=1 Tax=Phlebotomus papatasi TaxID=29031 RepID=UPI0024836E62|nr:protein borderless [Phlebotomus papatasi]
MSIPVLLPVLLGIFVTLCQAYDQDYILHRPPIYLESEVGSYVVFNCRLDFPLDTPIPYVLHWYKDGKNVFSWYDGVLTAADNFIGRINLLDNEYGLGKASVNLTALRESDGGWYQCRVIFPNRTPSTRGNGTWFHLTVDGRHNLLKVPPINLTVMEGEDAFFHCTMKHPDTSKVIWRQSGILLSDLPHVNSRSKVMPDGNLLISPTTMTDIGEYFCEITDELRNEKQIARAYLNVQYKAKVIYAPPEVYLPFGQQAILDCHFRANPPLTNLRWEKDGFLFDPYNVQGVFYKRNGSLFFSKVDDSHAGVYQCQPFNDLGTDGKSPLIKVVVQHPPILTMKPKPVYIHKLGDNVEMSCDARDMKGLHRPVIQWTRKDGLPLPYDRYSTHGGNLTLEKIVESDRGIYQCSVTNEAATVTADTELLIESVAPRPPFNLTANSTDTRITLKWIPGSVARPSITYIIWYRLAEAPEWRTLKVPSRSSMEATVSNLEPGKEYEFMVLGQDSYGDGIFSKAFRYFTKPRDFKDAQQYRDPIQQFAQIGPPRNLSVDQTPDGNYLVTWDPPEYGKELLRIYLVRWWLEPKHTLHGTAETRQTQYLVSQLDEDELYIFQVFSLSTTDYEAGSNEYEIYVPPYRRMRAIAIGTASGLMFLLVALLVFVYMRRKWFRSIHGSTEKIGH